MKIVGVTTTCLSRVLRTDEQWETLNFRAVRASAVRVLSRTDGRVVGVTEASPYAVQVLNAKHFITQRNAKGRR
jgi:hypothetical protein